MTKEINPITSREARNDMVSRTQSSVPATIDLNQLIQSLPDDKKLQVIQKATDEMVRLQVRAQEMNLNESASTRATLDHIDTVKSLETKGFQGHKVTSEMNTGAGTRRIESRSGATCFVVTASYGDTQHPHVLFFRSYRDHVLMNSQSGRNFTAWYYRHGPKVADFIRASPWAQRLSRTVLSVLRILARGHLKWRKHTLED